MGGKASVSLPFQSEKQLNAIVNALAPEVKRQMGSRSKVTVTKNSQFLVISVDAEDTIALRAALNAYLRWINSTVNVLQTLENAS